MDSTVRQHKNMITAHKTKHFKTKYGEITKTFKSFDALDKEKHFPTIEEYDSYEGP